MVVDVLEVVETGDAGLEVGEDVLDHPAGAADEDEAEVGPLGKAGLEQGAPGLHQCGVALAGLDGADEQGVAAGGERRGRGAGIGGRGVDAEGADGDGGRGEAEGCGEAADVVGDAGGVDDDLVGDGEGGVPVPGHAGDVFGAVELRVGDRDQVVAEAGVAEAVAGFEGGEGLGVEVEPVGAGGEEGVGLGEGDGGGEGHRGREMGDAAAVGGAESVSVGAEGEEGVLGALDGGG